MVTNDILKYDKSISGKRRQLLNIYSIFVTFDVSKLIGSYVNEVNWIHESNIFCIFLTWLVLKFNIFNIVKDSQFLNIDSIFSTILVSKCPISKGVNDLQ